MLRAIYDLPNPVPASTLDAIYELTEGNPFFIEEVLIIQVLSPVAKPCFSTTLLL